MRLVVVLFFMLSSSGLFAQSTWDDVYAILSNNCANSGCHLNGINSPNFSLPQDELYAALYDMPTNTIAANEKKNRLVYPGDPYRSYILRKASNPDFMADVPLESDEQNGMISLNMGNEDLELIRQWILYGAPEEGEVIDQSLISDYYNGNGMESVENPPAPPAEGQGFQIHLGPILIPPGGEQEYFYKYRMNNTSTIEVTGFDTEMGFSSHHFIIMKFSTLFGDFLDSTLEGLRIWDRHDHAEFVEVAQDSQQTRLPNGAAFIWNTGSVLDLNTHYINYSSSSVLAGDIYVNVYTQPLGTANQPMFAQLIPNLDLAIEPTGAPFAVRDTFSTNLLPKAYVWSLTSHAHQRSVDYDIFQPVSGADPLHIYDASCPDGIPGCSSPSYDYENPPTRFFEPFLETIPSEGVIHETTYINETDSVINWTWTSDGEMMVFVMRYLTDTVGVNFDEPVGINEATVHENSNFNIFPNPSAESYVNIDFDGSDLQAIYVYDILGNVIPVELEDKVSYLKIHFKHSLASGFYLLHLIDQQGNSSTSKFLIR